MVYYQHTNNLLNCQLTRMYTFIKAKLKKSDDQTNTDKIEWLDLVQNIILYQN